MVIGGVFSADVSWLLVEMFFIGVGGLFVCCFVIFVSLLSCFAIVSAVIVFDSGFNVVVGGSNVFVVDDGVVSSGGSSGFIVGGVFVDVDSGCVGDDFVTGVGACVPGGSAVVGVFVGGGRSGGALLVVFQLLAVLVL